MATLPTIVAESALVCCMLLSPELHPQGECKGNCKLDLAKLAGGPYY